MGCRTGVQVLVGALDQSRRLSGLNAAGHGDRKAERHRVENLVAGYTRNADTDRLEVRANEPNSWSLRLSIREYF